MLTPDQITAIAPDAASLKAGRDLGTPRKWESLGGDDEVLWGLAMGSGTNPYQTRVRTADLASKCSCPSRKFPCKHALGLMVVATAQPDVLTQNERPPWVTEWMDGHVARQEKAVARASEPSDKPVDEKAADRRRAKRDNRVGEGIGLLAKALLDLTREGFASQTARDARTWEALAKRMIDCQAPGLAGNLRHIADTVLRDPEIDQELPLELGRLHLLLTTIQAVDSQNDAAKSEIALQIGGKQPSGSAVALKNVEDQWFVAGRTVQERDRLITSATWLYGKESHRWARVIRFAPVMQAISEPWSLGASVMVKMDFNNGLYPIRATPSGDGSISFPDVPEPSVVDFENLLNDYASALTANPFFRSLAFLMALRPVNSSLVDHSGNALPWHPGSDLAFRVDCISAGRLTLMSGEWDGRHLRVLAIRDGDAWIPLTPQQA